MPRKTEVPETCALCGCRVHRFGEYAKPTVQGRSHATEHHFIPERFFGRSKNRQGTQRDGIFTACPWGFEGKTAVYCYECHEELIHNPILLPDDVTTFAELIRQNGLNETEKPATREKIASRIQLFHSAIATGLKTLLRRQQALAELGHTCINESNRMCMHSENGCESVHRALEKLPLSLKPGQVPFSNGLYFFYEKGETSSHGPLGRIVRIGNHPRSDDTLVRRLRQHYSGQKNGSVFRKFLGGALIRSLTPNSPCLMPTPGRGHWERQNDDACALCAPVEEQVSSLLRARFTFRCVEVVDREERNRLEELLIATISACNECAPSATWLGHQAYSSVVRGCGMWNSQSVGGAQLTPEDLRRFEELVGQTVNKWHLRATATVWRHVLPSVLTDYISRNNIDQVFVAGSAQYVSVLSRPRWWEPADCRWFVAYVGRGNGNPYEIVPRMLGEAVRDLLGSSLTISSKWISL
jgi:hypothetical protein